MPSTALRVAPCTAPSRDAMQLRAAPEQPTDGKSIEGIYMITLTFDEAFWITLWRVPSRGDMHQHS